MGRFSRFPGSRAQRTGPDAYVGQRESEDLRRLIPNQTEWIIGSNSSHQSMQRVATTLTNGGATVRFLPLRLTNAKTIVSKVSCGFNTAAGEVALYFYEDGKLKLIPGSQATFAAGGSYASVEQDLASTVTIPPGTRLFFAFRQTTGGTALLLRTTSNSNAALNHLFVVDSKMAKEYTRAQINEQPAAINAFPDFAFYSTEYANLL